MKSEEPDVTAPVGPRSSGLPARAAERGARSSAPGAARRAQGFVCRALGDCDLEALIAFLATGFPERDETYWQRALQNLRERTVPPGQTRYGYGMIDRGRIVGVILLIVCKTDTGALRGNLSSWYVEPAYRGFANLLLAAPFKLRDLTLINISAAPTTWPTIKAQGFAPYVSGTFQAVASLKPGVSGARLREVDATTAGAAEILRDHAAWGCLCYEITHEGRTYPFIFVRQRAMRVVPVAQLVYCTGLADFVRFAGLLGRALLRKGLPLVLVDSSTPIKGLIGVHRPKRGWRYYRGPEQPRLGDLAYTELAIFGP